MAVWVYVQDVNWWIGFGAIGRWVAALVAGCVADPPDVESFLVAADAYHRGLAVEVVNRLLAADRVRLGMVAGDETAVNVAEGRNSSDQPLAQRPGTEGQLTISLTRRLIVAHGKAAALVRERGEVEVFDRDRPTGRFVTYQLPTRWTMRAAREA